VTLTDQLHRSGELESSGGPAYIAQLMDGVRTSPTSSITRASWKEKSLLRGLIHATHCHTAAGARSRDDADTILDRAESQIFQLAEDRIRSGLVGVRDVVRENFERSRRYSARQAQHRTFDPALPSARNLTSGFQPSELLILAAGLSMGKTALALNIAENVAVKATSRSRISASKCEGVAPVAPAFLRREIDSHKFRTGHLSREDGGKFRPRSRGWRRRRSGSTMRVPLTVVEIGAKAAAAEARQRPVVAVVDYLQLISARGKIGKSQREVSSITRGLKASPRN